MSLLLAMTSQVTGCRYAVRTGQGNPYEGQNDITVTRDDEVVRSFNSLGDNRAYTNAKNALYALVKDDDITECKRIQQAYDDAAEERCQRGGAP